MTFLYLNSDKMGQGDDALGMKLMVKFLETLLENGEHIDAIGAVNGGIHLTCKGSPVIDTLKTFESRGTKIASCGTCLEYHDKAKDLQVGRVGTMVESVSAMLNADRVIRPN